MKIDMSCLLSAIVIINFHVQLSALFLVLDEAESMDRSTDWK